MTTILGLNAYHGDSAACLLRDGVPVAAAEEERFRRIKHWAGFPSEAIAYCLAEAGMTLNQVDHVAINRDPRANLWRKLHYTLAHRPSPALLWSRLGNRRRWAGLAARLRTAFPETPFHGRIHHVEHHLAHLASAFYPSPYEAAATVSIDGFGDFASAAWGLGSENRIAIEGRVLFPHSLGIFYQALTQHLGFPHYGDEYKVMGLAPYGAPKYLDEMRRIVRPRDDGAFQLDLTFFRHHREKVPYEWNDGAPSVGALYSPALEALLGPARAAEEPLDQRHRDLARSVQARFEEAVFHLLNGLHRRHGVDAVTLAGGCAFNSVMNGRIRAHTPFKQVYLQSAAGDAGGAIGAALAVWHGLSPDAKRRRMDHAYWGPGFDDQAIAVLLDRQRPALAEAGCKVARVDDAAALCQMTAQAIADGKVVGWFQGRMEWGPRALGNRSILGDPRRADMKDLLNRKIKRRESFRPFAPSVLREAVSAWFEQDDDVPFMMKVLQIREEKRPLVPAVTHVDGSGRLQTVSREQNPLYHRLIASFEAITGVPMLLNTSFNENEPVVCRPEEALDCFLRTRMDLLVLGHQVIERREGSDQAAL